MDLKNIKIPQLTQEQQKMLFLGVVIFVAGIYSYVKFFWSPISKRIEETQTKIEEVEKKIASAKAQEKRLPQLERELAQLNEQVVAAERRLPKKKEVPDLIYTLSDLGRKFRVEIRSIAPQGQSEKEYFREVMYGLTILGNYHSVAQFLTALGISERIFNTRNLVLAPSSGAPGITLQATFQLLAYQYKG
ncbi:MAG: type 4a pilus biogenesis protein PilO [Elusimicrobia bacterium]|nr:type 4a pilus biogenesis protein PilO [Elusimicrobiota bacterium]